MIKSLFRTIKMKTLKTLSDYIPYARKRNKDMRPECNVHDILQWGRGSTCTCKEQIDTMTPKRFAKISVDVKTKTHEYQSVYHHNGGEIQSYWGQEKQEEEKVMVFNKIMFSLPNDY